MTRKIFMTILNVRPTAVHSQDFDVSTDTDAFWDVVAECLLKFHSMKYDKACKRIADFKRQLRELPPALREDVIAMTYHAEPFDVACDLAQKELNFEEYREVYNSILQSYGG